MQTPSVEWTHNRERLLVPVAILPAANAANPFEVIRTEGLLDTGATGTGIRRDLAERLGLRAKGQRRVHTANGVIFAAEFLCRIGFICGDLDAWADGAEHLQPHVLERHILGFELQTGFAYPLLIGMDVIGQCDLALSRTGRAKLTLP